VENTSGRYKKIKECRGKKVGVERKWKSGETKSEREKKIFVKVEKVR